MDHLTSREASAIVGLAPATMRDAARFHRLPAKKVAGRWLFERADVERFARQIAFTRRVRQLMGSGKPWEVDLSLLPR